MAIAPKCACQVRRSHVTGILGKRDGWTPSVTSATQNIGFVGPTQTVGVDATPFSVNMVNGTGKVTVPFFNLPAWTRGNPLIMPNSFLRPWQNQLRTRDTYVQPMNQLVFEAQPVNVNAPNHVRIDLQTQAIDSQGVTAQGPFIGGGRSFRNWQVVVTATGNPGYTGTVTGTAVGRVHHIFG